MSVKVKKPNTPGQRGMTVLDYSEITTSTPEKSLVKTLKKNGGHVPVRPRHPIPPHSGRFPWQPRVCPDSRQWRASLWSGKLIIHSLLF